MNLELMAMRWLWIDKRCHYILRERSPRWGGGQPDVLGVTRDRYLTEIEIKRTASDFAADFRKRHRVNREHYLHNIPKQFYYLMPRELAEKVCDKVPEWAGLMTPQKDNWSQIEVVKAAPVNHASKRLTIRECVKMARLVTNHLMSAETRNESWLANKTYGEVWPYWYHQPGYTDYQI